MILNSYVNAEFVNNDLYVRMKALLSEIIIWQSFKKQQKISTANERKYTWSYYSGTSIIEWLITKVKVTTKYKALPVPML